ncbi:MAG: Fic/DOC family N-terminal domain-containing protein [Actinomycetales bacterium]
MLVPVHGTHFVPDPLGDATPELSARTFNAVAAARAAIAALDASARRLPSPALLRRPTLRVEAQSTTALEGTFAASRTCWQRRKTKSRTMPV